MRHLVGMSVSFCIREMVRGNVAYEDVLGIVGGTKITNGAGFRRVIATYRAHYWEDDPDAGERIFRQLWAAGRIRQPRLRGHHFSAYAPDGSHWRRVRSQ